MCKAYSNNTLSSAFRACVNRKHVCDGQKDCPLGDDEDNCSQKRECEPDTKCEHSCITTAAKQPACSCKPGYVLAEDEYSYADNYSFYLHKLSNVHILIVILAAKILTNVCTSKIQCALKHVVIQSELSHVAA